MHTVKSIGVLSFAKMNAAVYGAMALLFMPIILLSGAGRGVRRTHEQSLGRRAGRSLRLDDAGALRGTGFRRQAFWAA